MKYTACLPLIRKYTTNNPNTTTLDTKRFAVGKMIKTGITPNFKEGSAYGDNELAEYKKKFNYAEVSLEITTIPIDAAVAMFGLKKVGTTDASYEDAEDSESNYVCYGFIYGECVNDITKYVTVFLPRVKFDLPTEEYETEGENIVFGSHSITGRAIKDPTLKKWRVRKYFDTLATAISSLETQIGGTLQTAGSGGGTIISDGASADVTNLSAVLTSLGKPASELQSDVVINETEISGTIHYVTGFTGFSGVAEEQEGHFLALHFADETADKITVELVGGTSGETELDEDGICVFRITSNTQTISVKSYVNDEYTEISYSLNGLTLEEN